MQEHSAAWQEQFIALGYPDAQPLAVGMEGAVYRLDAGTIGKVWGRRPAPELRRLQCCYRSIAETPHAAPFQLPAIRDVLTVRDTTITIERLLPGVPLATVLPEPLVALSPAVVGAILAVLRGLAALPATASMRDLPVLDETRPLWRGCATWADALGGLIARRVARFGPRLASHVPRRELKMARLRALLAALEPPALSIIHGDLVPANILVGDDQRPTAVLDFGFLSTVGDPAFEAATAAALCDMYGPHARAIERRLDDAIRAEFGYDPHRLVLYKAAYALITSNAYNAEGADGHFAWCVRLLQRPEVGALLDPVG
jgi:aminoglycoside phosphotransferase (APT) family kinase protein